MPWLRLVMRCAVAAVFVAGTVPTRAGTIAVTDIGVAGVGTCTLGQAIYAANLANNPTDATPAGATTVAPLSDSLTTTAGAGTCAGGATLGPNTIELFFFPAQTLTFSAAEADNYWYGPNALPPIASTITIEGFGVTLNVADGTTRLRFFFVGADPQSSATPGYNTPGPGNLTLHDLMLSGGRQKGGDSFFGGGGAGMGGAIFNQGALSLNAVTFNDNQASGGNSDVATAGFGGGGMGADTVSGNGGGMGGAVPQGTGEPGSAGGNATAGSSGAGGAGGGIANGLGGSASTASIIAGGSGGDGGGGGGRGGTESDASGGGGGGSGFGGGNGGVGGTPEIDGGMGGGGGDFGAGGSASPEISMGGGGGGVGGGGGEGEIGNGGGGGFGGGGGLDGGGGGFGGGSVSGNFRGGWGLGGAIFNHAGTVTLLNSTLTGNTAAGGNSAAAFDTGGNGYGGGIFNLNGSVTISFSTFAFNAGIAGSGGSSGSSGNGDGGSIYSQAYNGDASTGSAQATLKLANSILADSLNGKDLVVDQPANVSGGLSNKASASTASAGKNLVMSSANTNNAPALPAFDFAVDPNLAGLANNGANNAPRTMAFATRSSVAINAGICTDANDNPVTIDERGFPRLVATCDLGAYDRGDEIFADGFELP